MVPSLKYRFPPKILMTEQQSSAKEAANATAVEKAIQLLLTLSHEHRELGTTELGRKLGLHKATVSRILLQLAEHGFVYKNNETRKYWLGPAVHQLGMTMADVNFKQVTQIACTHIDELSAQIDETVALEIWLGNSTVTTYSAVPKESPKVVPQGELLAPHAAAGAKAILAYTHEARIDQLLQRELTSITKNTVTDREKLKDKLSAYFSQGYSVDREEMHYGICAVASPIFDQLKQPMAALSVLCPVANSERLEDPLLLEKLKASTRLISRELAANRVRMSSH